MSLALAALLSRRTLAAPAITGVQRRTLASTVLLNRNWEASSVAELRQEARERGLPTSGNKATLVTRIRAHEQQAVSAPEFTPVAPIATPGGARHAHVLHPDTTPTAETAAPAPGADAPGIPPEKQPRVFPKQYLDVKIPNLSTPEPEIPVQIPYSPDFWHSQAAPTTQPVVPPVPKLLVVAGESTHPGGGPAPSVHENVGVAPATSSTPSGPVVGEPGASIWADIAQDIGLPTRLPSLAGESKPEKLSFEGVAEKTEAYGGTRPSERTLDPEERKGAWVLGGILAGAWLLSGYFAPGSELEKEAKKHAAAAKEAASQKAQEVKEVAAKKAEEAKTTVREKTEAAKAKVTGK